MASNSILASMAVALTADVSAFNRGMAEARRELAGFRRAGELMKDFGENMTKYVTAPLAGLAAVSLKSAGDIQALKKGLEVVSGSAGAAQKEFNDLKEVAKLPGLTLEGAVQGAVNLQAAGFSAELAKRSLMAFGNGLAAVGKGGTANLDGVNLALTQILNKPKLMAGDINQLRERLPQLAGAMKNAFGTMNSEDLQKMGVSPQVFIEKIIAEFEKIPKVTGGINNSFENLKDSSVLALANLGDAINKNLNVEGVLNGFADFLSRAAEGFSALSPGVQQFIIIGGAVAAAIGPVLFGLGALSAAVPVVVGGFTVLSTAFAAITAPMLLIGAAVAGAAILIIENWDTIKAYFTTGEGGVLFDKIADTAVAAFDRLKQIISDFIIVAETIWDNFGGGFRAAAAIIWSGVKNVFSTGVKALEAILDIFRAAFELNWGKLWQGLKNLGVIAVNATIDLIAGMVTAIPKLFDGLFKGLNINNAFTDGLRASISDTEALAERLKLHTTEVYKNTAAVQDNVKAKDDLAKTPPPPPPPPAPPAPPKTPKYKANSRVDYASYSDKSPIGAGDSENLIGTNIGGKLIIPAELKLLPVSPEATKEVSDSLLQPFNNFVASVNTAVTDLAVNSFVLLGESLGSVISGGDGFSNFLDNMLKMIVDFAASMGKQLIVLGLGKIALDELFTSIAGGPAAVIAGIALVAAAGAVRSSLSKGVGHTGATPSAPRSSSPSYSGASGGGGFGTGRVEFVISGSSLQGILKRNDYLNQRFGR